MDFSEYTNDALLEMLSLCAVDPHIREHVEDITNELTDRLKAHEHNTNIFSPYGITSKMTKTKTDFIQLTS